MRALAIVASFSLGLVVAGFVLVLGPSTEVVCGAGSLLDRLAPRAPQPLGAGHIDGPLATLCTVPTFAAWLVALAALIPVTAAGMWLAGRSPRSRGGGRVA